MKKFCILTLFGVFFCACVFYIFTHFNRIQTDIFSLINFNDNQEERLVLKSMQDELANDFSLVSNSKELLEKAEILASGSGIFEKFKIKTDINVSEYLSELNRLKLAFLSEDTAKRIMSGEEEFFKDSAASFFNQFVFKPLNARDDFFAIAAHSSLANQKVSFNISDMTLEIKDEGSVFYLVKARLKSKYDSKELIKFYEELKTQAKSKDAKIFMSSGALYSAFGKASGDKESVYMSLASLFLTSLFLLSAFRNAAIFQIVFIAIFGFACGFCASLIVFDNLNIMVVIIGTSLVGLMFDFALHWLGKFQREPIRKESVREMLKIFLLGLFITMSGYGVFILAPLELLRQVAVFSFFTLLGAFLFTYFCLPSLLEGRVFSQSPKFSEFLNGFYKFCFVVSKKIGLKFLIASFIVLNGFLILNLSNLTARDNIKDYSNSPQNLIDDSVKISTLIGINASNSMIVVKNGDDAIDKEKSLIKELKAENLLKDYSAISKIFLSEAEQDSVKEAFKKAKLERKVITIYERLGFDEDTLNREFDKIIDLKTLSVDEILKTDLANDFKRFILENNGSVIYADGFVKDAKSDEILARHNAFNVDFVSSLNQNFTDAKKSAAVLKVAAFCMAFVFLWLFFGFTQSIIIMLLISLGVSATLCVFVVFGVNINIFAIFGLILASAVGIDYMIFAVNKNLSDNERIFGILAASLTSFISFFMLTFSATKAISVFGLAVSLSIAFYGVAASVLSVKNS